MVTTLIIAIHFTMFKNMESLCSTHLPTSSSSDNHQFVLCVSDSISVLFPMFSYFISAVPHVNKMVWYLSFSVCIVLLGITPSRSIHVVDNDKISFFFYCWVIFHSVCVCVCVCVCVYTISLFLTHLSMGTEVPSISWLPLAVNDASVNRGAHISFWLVFLLFLRKIPRSGTAGPYGSSCFQFLRKASLSP